MEKSLETMQLEAQVRIIREPRQPKPYVRAEVKREVREILAEVAQ